MRTLKEWVIEYPWGYQFVDAYSKTGAKEQATSEPIVWVGTRNEWNARHAKAKGRAE